MGSLQGAGEESKKWDLQGGGEREIKFSLREFLL